MDNDDIVNAITVLFTAPTEAVVDAASHQRRIWIKWLKDIDRLINPPTGVDKPSKAQANEIILRHLELAPVWKMSAQISIGIGMRIASIRRMEGGIKLGIGTSMVSASGSFGFMSESASESTLQARANYAMSNEQEVTLKEYLNDLGVGVTDPTTLTKAIDRLAAATVPLPSLAEVKKS
ncbi:hypothetical protein [Rubellicoccus peritrichatus]|uniref:Uncharacterized protein n=1 Tax=Rubellicoccus peritrichatus TaxID=3080537 RepID=A0AAQ3QXB0_9BACT|nr:hypothetical protein [Puniceicoccus sp. CR14]WOO42690.1 hypothetical protein RZN69_06265 [Puniceicoccus sp. CR14]